MKNFIRRFSCLFSKFQEKEAAVIESGFKDTNRHRYFFRPSFSFNFVLNFTAFAVALCAVLRNLLCVDLSNDTWQYHLPFAARIWGIVPKQMFELPDFHENYYAGFPLLLEFLQGGAWALFHSVHAIGLVNIVLITSFFIFLRSYLDIPYRLAIISLFAVPMFQAHTACWYIDLPANLFASIFILMNFLLFTRPNFLNAKNIILMFAAAACAANTKFQMLPVTGLFYLAFMARTVCLKTGPLKEIRQKWKVGGLVVAAFLLLMPVIFLTETKNVLLHHHPIYPMNIKDPETLINIGIYVPQDLKDAPMPFKWFHSLFETRTTAGRWTIDASSETLDSPGFRLGGYFGVYVIFQLLVFAWICLKKRDRGTVVAAVIMATLTTLTSFLPQAHELRYYLYWVICLICFNAFFLHQRNATSPTSSVFFKGYEAVCWGVLVFVLILTGGKFIKPEYRSFRDIKNSIKQISSLQPFIRPGDSFCFYRHDWRGFFIASQFNPPKPYSVKAAFSLSECRDKDLILGVMNINGQEKNTLLRKVARDQYQVVL